MPVKLDTVVPWGRSLAEYRAMFSLRDEEMASEILDCGAGPSSFCADMDALGRRVIAVDPIYAHSADEIRARVEATRGPMMEQVRRDPGHFVWKSIASPEHLEETRMGAMARFLEDFAEGQRDGRYQAMELPRLDFADGSFDLALCSHFLFLYSEQLSQQFHREAVAELKRVARELRVFPVLDLNGRVSAHLDAVRTEWNAELVTVGYEFLRGANQMLVVR